MYNIQLLLHLLKKPLSPGERLGLMQYLYGIGFGEYRGEIPEFVVKDIGHQLVLANREQSLSIIRSELQPLLVECPWVKDEPEKLFTCLAGTAQEVSQVLDLLDEEVTVVEIKINDHVYQAVQCPPDLLLDTARLPDCRYSHSLDVVYTIQEGEISQRVAKRNNRLEALGRLRDG